MLFIVMSEQHKNLYKLTVYICKPIDDSLQNLELEADESAIVLSTLKWSTRKVSS